MLDIIEYQRRLMTSRFLRFLPGSELYQHISCTVAATRFKYLSSRKYHQKADLSGLELNLDLDHALVEVCNANVIVATSFLYQKVDLSN